MNIELHHLGLAVGDVDSTTDALVAALGAERLDAPSAGHSLVRLGSLHLALVPRTDGDPRTRAWGDHLALTLSAAIREEAVLRLRERGWASEHVHGRVYVRHPDGSLTLELLVE